MSDVDKSERGSRDLLCTSVDEDSEHGVGLLTGQQRLFLRPGSNLRGYLVYATIAVIWILSLFSTAKLSSRGCSKDGFAVGFDTDLEPLREVLQVEQIKFTGSFEYDENGTLYRTFEPGKTQYVGEPNSKIDAAWEALVEVDGVDLIGDEAASVVGTTFQKPGGAWLVGVDGFHQLHCINMLYRSLYPDYYPPKHSPHFHKIHMEHCIDYLRQSVMCSLDITPIKVEWTTKWNQRIHHFDTWHTCRNFEKVKSWALDRSRRKHPVPEPGQPWTEPLPGPGVRED